jgi:16S rRNA (adenine1518-N6/adenine1519-N6)-dimethyltransferase
VAALLRHYQLHLRKGLGQHLLADPNVLNKIVQVAELTADSLVLEIGPGLGTLTRPLARIARQVIAVELDEAMFGVLRQELAGLPNLELVLGDILQLDPAALLASATGSVEQPYTVVANLPYYITSAVIRHLLECSYPPRRLVLTVQREVAQRIVATPGHMSLLAVSVQFYGEPRLMARIPAGAFIPPPKVDSAVIRIDAHAAPPVVVPGVGLFFRVVRAGFSQKRKQLRNSLSAGLGLSSQQVLAIMARAGIQPQRRAQTLSMAEWAALANAVAENRSEKPVV